MGFFICQNMNHIEYLKSLGASAKVIEWASKYADLADAWDVCHRSDWMLWLDKEADLLDARTLHLITCAFVRRTPLSDGRTPWDLLTDKRSRTAVVVAERYANGEATDEELAAAQDAAWDAAGAAARVAAGAAALDVSCAAWYATAAAIAAAEFVAQFTVRHTAQIDAWCAALSAQADIIREIAGNPFRKDPL